MSNSSTWPIDRTLSDATTLDQSGPGSDGNEGLLHFLQSSSFTGALPLDCLESYLGHSLYPSAEMQSVYSTAPADWALEIRGKTETIQTTALLKSARILRRILETKGDLPPFRRLWKTTN